MLTTLSRRYVLQCHALEHADFGMILQMLQCHALERGDFGMMLQMEVER